MRSCSGAAAQPFCAFAARTNLPDTRVLSHSSRRKLTDTGSIFILSLFEVMTRRLR